METQILDQKIQQLSELEKQINALTELKETVRKEVFTSIEEANLGQYKNDLATVSYVERKSVKIVDEEKLLKELEDQKIVKYYTVVPQHSELNKQFQEDVREGKFNHELIEVTSSKNLAIRFAKK